ncbi:hypothetical protein ACFVRE_43570, partial [Streptomyces sp. NPDC057910]
MSVMEMGDWDKDGPRIGELSLFRLRAFTGYDRTLVADGESGDLLHVAETVFDRRGEYSAEFEEAIEMPVGDLLVLDR